MRKAKFMAMAISIMTLGTILAPVTSNAKVSVSDDLYYEHYKLSPQCVRTSFEEDDWDLEVVKGNELNYIYGSGDYYSNGYDISGVTVYDIRTIYLSDSPGFAEISLNHEMGHYVDYSYYTYYGIQPSQTKEFTEIFKGEAAASSLFESYELSDTTEYFAQSYWSYVEDPQALLKFYPRTYYYISNVVDGLDTALEDGLNRVYDGKQFMRSADAPDIPYTHSVSYNEVNKKLR